MSDTVPPPVERPLGPEVDFTGARPPAGDRLVGRFVTLAPIDPDGDAPALFAASHEPEGDPAIWTYLYDGPYADAGAYAAALSTMRDSADPLYYAVEVGGVAQGIVSYLAIVPEHGTIELGNIWFGPALQRTPAATEAIFLLAAEAFDQLGYRRVEWKCNALNAPSRRAAERFGFAYEGTFLQHRVVKGRNRDTAWFAITDVRWPQLRQAFQRWLDPDNFDAEGRQRRSLEALRP